MARSAMMLPEPVLASAHASAGDFFKNLFTGALQGDMLSLFVVGVVALILIRLMFARWVFVLAKQVLVFGGLGYAVWFGAGEAGERWGNTVGSIVLIGGAAIVAILFAIMLYVYLAKGGKAKVEAQQKARVEAKTHATGDVPAKPVAASGAATKEPMVAHGHPEPRHIDDIVSKLNVLGATKDQNLLTVLVLILVAEFGVFTSKTVAAPDAQTGMIIGLVFALGAVVFVKTSYKNYMRGVTHFVFATVFAAALSILMLVYWQQTSPAPCPETGACLEIGWALAMSPSFYFASDALIAAITGVAFSTLLTKGGG